MNDVRRAIFQLERWMAANTALPLSGEDQADFRRKAERLSQRFRNLEDRFLVIGLLGGTGVGKSSLMNLLAGAPIASVSHRRPHTDHVLIYRHENAPIPRSLHEPGVPIKEVVHRADAVEQVLMCDLPDFDSLVTEHRERVCMFLRHVDVVLWVTTPEKYADRRFYEFLKEIPKARKNFLFVMNKVDLFFEGEGPARGYAELEQVMRSFLSHLHRAGLTDPEIYTVSALDARRPEGPSAWNQFPLLKRSIFRSRDVKEIRAVKEANLDVEARLLLERLRSGLEPWRRLSEILERWLNDAPRFEKRWKERGLDLWRKWLSTDVVDEVAERLEAESPGSGGMGFLSAVRRRFSASSSDAHDVGKSKLFGLSERYAELFRVQTALLADEVRNRMLQDGIDETFRKEWDHRLKHAVSDTDLESEIRRLTMFFLERDRGTGWKRFLWEERFMNKFFTVLLLFSLGGASSWRHVLAEPGMSTIIGLVVSMIDRLFSPRGVAALCSYGILRLWAGWRAYRRYKKSLQGRARRIIDALQQAVEKAWMQEWKRLEENLARWRREVNEKIHTWESLLGEENRKP